MSNVIINPFLFGCSAPVTAFTGTINSDSTGWVDYSFRCTATLIAGGNEVRITSRGHSSATMLADNVGVGLRSGSTEDTTATPVEVTYSAASGFESVNGALQVSDWIPLGFSVVATDQLLVIYDIGTDSAKDDIYRITSGSETQYQQAATNSYNVQAPAGFSAGSTGEFITTLIEIRTC